MISDRQALVLAESWRQLATRIEVKYSESTSVKVSCVVRAYEQCAEELEEKVKEMEEKKEK